VSTNSNSPVGTLYGPRQNITLLATNAMRHADEYKDVVVAWRNGAPIKLSEIARVIDGVENDKIASWFNDNRSILLAVQRQPSANTVDVVDAIRERMPTYRAQVPASVNLEVQLDRSRSIRDSVADVQITLMIAIALVIMISGFVSLTLTPMLCARVLKTHHEGEKQILILRIFEMVFKSWLRAYEWSLDRVLKYKSVTLVITFATLFLTGYLYYVI